MTSTGSPIRPGPWSTTPDRCWTVRRRPADSIKIWARSFAGITDSLHNNDPQIRNILQTGPGAVSEVSALLNQIKPTLPVLLANLTTVGQVLVTYNRASSSCW